MGTIGNMENFGQTDVYGQDYQQDQDVSGGITDRVKEYGERIEQRAEDMNRHEGNFTRRVEKITSALPSSTWLMLAGGAIVGSLVLKLIDRPKTANFVGDWVPTFLLLGIYNKLVKLHGSDRESM
jgi:hypothetical protein